MQNAVASTSQEPLRRSTATTGADARSMFGNNNLIQGGSFVLANSMTSVGNNSRKGFKLLQKRVVTSAFHNSAQRVDPPRCHPHTRDTIMQQIFDWITGSKNRDTWLMWLNGAAGAGKSAIAQSIAERCMAAGISVASFFFSRWDDTRDNMKSLVATLAYQIIQSVPQTLDDIIQTIEQNPLIFEQSLESQFECLIIQPLLRVKDLPKTQFDVNHVLWRLIIIDGLDECANRDLQRSLVKVLGNLLNRKSLPVVFLVASRAENHLQMAFEQRDITRILTRLSLDDVQKAEDGIRVFLKDKFAEIKEIHPYRSSLDEDWPKPEVVEQIVAKSSGQFIYASVVISYISFPNALPADRLDVINGIRLRSPSSENPFANLDALYQHIFSEVTTLDMALDILAYTLLSRQRNIVAIARAFGLTASEVEVSLADLTSVVTCKPEGDRPNLQDLRKIRFLHASLRDFLLEKSRSAAYYIDSKDYSTKLACMLLDKPAPPDPDPKLAEPYRNEPLLSLLQTAKASSRLYDGLWKFDMNFPSTSVSNTLVYPMWTRRPVMNSISLSYMLDFLDALKNLKFDDDQDIYFRHRDFIAKNISLYPGVLSDEETQLRVFSHSHELWNMICNEARNKREIGNRTEARKPTLGLELEPPKRNRWSWFREIVGSKRS